MGEGRLAEPRRAEQQHVVERLAPPAGGVDEDAELLAGLGLPDEVGEPHRAQAAVEGLLLARVLSGGDQALFAHASPPVMARRASRMISSLGRSADSTDRTALLASTGL